MAKKKPPKDKVVPVKAKATPRTRSAVLAPGNRLENNPDANMTRMNEEYPPLPSSPAKSQRAEPPPKPTPPVQNNQDKEETRTQSSEGSKAIRDKEHRSTETTGTSLANSTPAKVGGAVVTDSTDTLMETSMQGSELETAHKLGTAELEPWQQPDDMEPPDTSTSHPPQIPRAGMKRAGADTVTRMTSS
jgi:hypothetical protein